MLQAVVDGERGYSGAEYTMELSMATAGPVVNARIIPQCSVQAVLTHILSLGGSYRVVQDIIEHTAALGETIF